LNSQAKVSRINCGQFISHAARPQNRLRHSINTRSQISPMGPDQAGARPPRDPRNRSPTPSGPGVARGGAGVSRPARILIERVVPNTTRRGPALRAATEWPIVGMRRVIGRRATFVLAEIDGHPQRGFRLTLISESQAAWGHRWTMRIYEAIAHGRQSDVARAVDRSSVPQRTLSLLFGGGQGKTTSLPARGLAQFFLKLGLAFTVEIVPVGFGRDLIGGAYHEQGARKMGEQLENGPGIYRRYARAGPRRWTQNDRARRAPPPDGRAGVGGVAWAARRAVGRWTTIL